MSIRNFFEKSQIGFQLGWLSFGCASQQWVQIKLTSMQFSFGIQHGQKSSLMCVWGWGVVIQY
jgi:hypothetical protein